MYLVNLPGSLTWIFKLLNRKVKLSAAELRNRILFLNLALLYHIPSKLTRHFNTILSQNRVFLNFLATKTVPYSQAVREFLYTYVYIYRYILACTECCHLALDEYVWQHETLFDRKIWNNWHNCQQLLYYIEEAWAI